jgi:hypothetical protein
VTVPGAGEVTGDDDAAAAVFDCLRLLARAPFSTQDVAGVVAALSAQAEQMAALAPFPFAVRDVVVPRSVDDWLLDAAAESHGRGTGSP